MTTAPVARPKDRSSSAAESLPPAKEMAKPGIDARAASRSDRAAELGGMGTIGRALPTQRPSSAAESLPRAIETARPNGVPRAASPCSDQACHDNRIGRVGASAGSDAALTAASELLYCAAFLDDVEALRVSTENRLRSLELEGLPVEMYSHQAVALQKLEHEAILALQRAVRRHPLAGWIKQTVGVGEKQGARLIAAIGPSVTVNTAEMRPRRGPAELWAYCGFVPGQRRRKGVQANWNATAKMRAFLVAESCIKQAHSPYRRVYDAARANWVHREVPAAHQHAHALRLVAKAVLRDLFVAARGCGA